MKRHRKKYLLLSLARETVPVWKIPAEAWRKEENPMPSTEGASGSPGQGSHAAAAPALLAPLGEELKSGKSSLSLSDERSMS